MIIQQRYSPYGATHQKPKKIIIHAMGEYVDSGDGKFEYAPDLLIRKGLSAHAMVTPNANILRCRQDDQGAYHALGHNTDTLGVEILVAGRHDYASFAEVIKTQYMPDAQYQALLELCRDWKKKHKIKVVERHSDVSPGRKIDPGAGFPMARFLSDLEAA